MSISRFIPLAAGLALLVALGCEDTQKPVEPEPDPCPAGTLGCACDDGECPEGRCADGLCVACPAGTLRCPCVDGVACADDLVCGDDALCVEDACPAGTADCPCGPEQACDDGLTCMDESCVAVPECPPGALDCPCDGGACDDALVCINDLCRDCPADRVGCPCADGACGGGLICDTGACRAIVACADAGCGPQQLCEEGDGADARCLEDCAEGFAWDPVEARCVDAPPSCEPAAPGSIAAECAGQNRECLPLGDDDAACGSCLAGFVEADGVCERDARATCDGNNAIGADCAARNRACIDEADGAVCGGCLDGFALGADGECQGLEAFGPCDAEADCPEDTVCSARRPAEDARCLPSVCGAGETFDLREGACTDRCACDGEGLTGAPWPVTDWNGDCVCETTPGFFFNTSIGSRRAEACDADGDGWTRRSAFAHIESPDEAVRLNARCDLRSIDRVLLVNERGQSLELSVETLSGGLAEFEPMYETDESDDQAEALERQSVAYGARRFHAAELNPLTKACVTALDDFNDNGVSDLREHHRAAPGRPWMATFAAASYFVELHTGHFEAPAEGEQHGRYVIAERSRCDLDFALGYAGNEGPYAAECMRRRDRGYDAGEPIGHDFARWSCADPDGACPVLPPPVVGASLDAVPPHGLCDADPADDPIEWRGMSHASQFKCVELVSDQAAPITAFQRPRSAVQQTPDSAARLTLNACSLTACADGEEGCVESDRDAVANPGQARLTCTAEHAAVIDDPEALVGRVGFVALRFADYGDVEEYAGGCINEQSDWPELCPGFDPDFPGGTVGEGNPGNFGKIICGCGLNYGGAGCDRGCPDGQLHVGGTAPADAGCVNGYCVTTPDASGLDGGRSGFWMCGDFAATSYEQTLPEQGAVFSANGAVGAGINRLRGTITVRGTMPTFGTDGARMCQTVDEEGRCAGFTVR